MPRNFREIESQIQRTFRQAVGQPREIGFDVSPRGTFTKEPQEIAETLADKKVSPKGIGSGIRMVQYFINRGGKGLSPTRRKKLERAKAILHEKLEDEKKKKKRSSTSKAGGD